MNRSRFLSSTEEQLPRTAFSLVEVLVAIAILGILLAIALPAVQSARAASRANACRSNLHQLGIAIANCEQVTGVIPTWVQHREFTPGPGDFWALLPYLDQKPLWERLEADGGPPEFVDVLLCPDDSIAWQFPGWVNYAYNGGTTFLDFDPKGSGIMSRVQGGRALREIEDGLSNTAILSERLLGNTGTVSPEEARRETGRYLWWTEQGYQNQGQEHLAAEACRTHTTTPLPRYLVLSANMYLFLSDGYTHLLPPNHRACYNASEPFEWSSRSLIPPSSNHAGGAFVLMGDGQVRFVSESVGDVPWRAAGTRAGHEAERLP